MDGRFNEQKTPVRKRGRPTPRESDQENENDESGSTGNVENQDDRWNRTRNQEKESKNVLTYSTERKNKKIPINDNFDFHRRELEAQNLEEKESLFHSNKSNREKYKKWKMKYHDLYSKFRELNKLAQQAQEEYENKINQPRHIFDSFGKEIPSQF